MIYAVTCDYAVYLTTLDPSPARYPGESVSAVGNGRNKQEVISHTTGNPAQCSYSHTDASTRTSAEVLFSTKVQLYQIWIFFFIFYSEIQHIPSASDYIKTYNVQTVDISTLSFTVSGLNRHYFSGFKFLQEINSKGWQKTKRGT